MKRPHKYGAVQATFNGHKFPSKAEAKRYGELLLLERSAVISGLTLQPEFYIVVNGQLICKYIADFSYFENEVYTVEDTKGFRTPEYRLKAKLLKATHNITILETGRSSKRKLPQRARAA